MTRDEFRAELRRLLEAAAETDEGQVVRGVLEYGRRSVRSGASECDAGDGSETRPSGPS